MHLWKSALACGVFLAAALAVTAETDTAKKIVGKWQLTKAENIPPGAVAVIEFTRDGKIKVEMTLGDKSFKGDGTYEVKGQTISTKIDYAGKVKAETNTVKRLTAKELVVQDEKGKVEEYKRLEK